MNPRKRKLNILYHIVVVAWVFRGSPFLSLCTCPTAFVTNERHTFSCGYNFAAVSFCLVPESYWNYRQTVFREGPAPGVFIAVISIGWKSSGALSGLTGRQRYCPMRRQSQDEWDSSDWDWKKQGPKTRPRDHGMGLPYLRASLSESKKMPQSTHHNKVSRNQGLVKAMKRME
jgi:hypothetical protein